MISVLYYGDLSSFRVLSLFLQLHIGLALYCSMPQLDSCVPACNHELETLALLSYFFGLYRNLLEHANVPNFFLIDASSESTGESVHWQKLD